MFLLYSEKIIYWKLIRLLPRTMKGLTWIISLKNDTQCVLLNEKLLHFKKIKSPMCSFCKQENENVIHFFSKVNCS